MRILKHIRKTNEVVRKQSDHIQWRKLVVTILGLIGLSFGLAFLFQDAVTKLHLPLYGFAWLAYLTVFFSSLAVNLTIIVPVPIGLSIMITAATIWNPVLIALVAAVGVAGLVYIKKSRKTKSQVPHIEH